LIKTQESEKREGEKQDACKTETCDVEVLAYPIPSFFKKVLEVSHFLQCDMI